MSEPARKNTIDQNTRTSLEQVKPSYSIDIVNLSKSFKRATLGKDYSTLKASFLNVLFRRKKRRPVYTHAIKDLTMRIPKGASVGILGSNGSGKSTLLKLITGIYKPDKGSVSLNGRVAALIELGAGFHPDFTGRENLYLGGVLHGLSRAEIDSLFDEIVHFAELEQVIDDPVRTYSSGMFMRLGFSLAVHTNPDILLVDEVLAVGDAAFVSKCKERIARLRKQGKTLLLVTHDLDAIERWCDEALWLNKGVVEERGDPRRVIDAYREFVEKGEERELLEESEHECELDLTSTSETAEVVDRQRWGSREVEITDVRAKDASGEHKLLFHPEDELHLEFDYHNHHNMSDIVFGIGIHRSDGLCVHGTNTQIERIEFENLPKQGTICYSIKRLGLLDGNYLIDIAAHRADGYPYDYHKGYLKIAVRWPEGQPGVILPEHNWSLKV